MEKTKYTKMTTLADFQRAVEEMVEAVKEIDPTINPENVNVYDPLGYTFRRFHIEQERLTDSSIVHNVIIA